MIAALLLAAAGAAHAAKAPAKTEISQDITVRARASAAGVQVADPEAR